MLGVLCWKDMHGIHSIMFTGRRQCWVYYVGEICMEYIALCSLVGGSVGCIMLERYAWNTEHYVHW